VLLNLFISLVGIAVYAMIIKRLMPSINLMPVFNWAATKKVLGFGLYSVLSRIAYLANYQADRLVTATILGVSWVTYYAVPFMIINRLTSVTVTLGTVIFPAISELQGRNRFDTITDLYLVSYRVIIVLSTALCLPLLVFGGRLLALWMGVDFGQKAGIAIALITIGLYVNSFTNVPSFVADGLGRPKINGLSSLCHAVLNVGLAIPLARRFGITGVALAFLGSNVLVAPLFIWYVNGRLLHLSLGKLLLKVYLKPLAAGACLLSVLAAVPVHRVYTLPVLLSLFSASSFLYLGACYLGGVLPGREKLLIREYARIAIWRLAAVLHGSR
jgi:O-antigen/teichoic acid export membrane protein